MEFIMVVEISGSTYNEIKEVFGFYNTNLFDGNLTIPLITEHTSWSKSCFVYKAYRVKTNYLAKKPPELAINLGNVSYVTDIELLNELVHEMVHIWQDTYGVVPRRGYHSLEWASKMKIIGLYPSSTGKPGGKARGQVMSHYIIKGGLLDNFTKVLLENTPLKLKIKLVDYTYNNPFIRKIKKLKVKPTLKDNISKKQEPKFKKIKKGKSIPLLAFICYKCNQNAIGIRSLKIDCGLCKSPMTLVADEYVYLIKAYTTPCAYKIGASKCPKSRFKQLNIMPFELKLLHTIPCFDMFELESKLHKLFSHRRNKGEWFDLSQSDVEYILSICKYTNNNFSYKEMNTKNTIP